MLTWLVRFRIDTSPLSVTVIPCFLAHKWTRATCKVNGAPGNLSVKFNFALVVFIAFYYCNVIKIPSCFDAKCTIVLFDKVKIWFLMDRNSCKRSSWPCRQDAGPPAQDSSEVRRVKTKAISELTLCLFFETSPRSKPLIWKWVWFALKSTCRGAQFHKADVH